MNWQADLVGTVARAQSEHEIFARVQDGARALGFEHCAYGMRMPMSFTNPRTVLLNNYPKPWRDRYEAAGYLKVDPTVAHARSSRAPVVWSDRLFSSTPALWDEARSAGLQVGWAQSSLDKLGALGMLTLSRSTEPLGASELDAQAHKMRWLVHIAHLSLARVIKSNHAEHHLPRLTCRELEILRWTADGKSSQEIADILVLSKNTVDFHIKNAISKLQTANKTAAVVRAAMLGLLH